MIQIGLLHRSICLWVSYIHENTGLFLLQFAAFEVVWNQYWPTLSYSPLLIVILANLWWTWAWWCRLCFWILVLGLWTILVSLGLCGWWWSLDGYGVFFGLWSLLFQKDQRFCRGVGWIWRSQRCCPNHRQCILQLINLCFLALFAT